MRPWSRDRRGRITGIGLKKKEERSCKNRHSPLFKRYQTRQSAPKLQSGCLLHYSMHAESAFGAPAVLCCARNRYFVRCSPLALRAGAPFASKRKNMLIELRAENYAVIDHA